MAERVSSFGAVLRARRLSRGLTQLALSLEAETSARHLSCLESGKARPSRKMAVHLADVLQLSAHDRELMLLCAGFVVTNASRALPPFAPRVCDAVSVILAHHEPFPAIVLDRHWNVVASNGAAKRFRALVGPGEAGETNLLRLMMHPLGFRPNIVDWHEALADVRRKVRHQVAAYPDDDVLRQLLGDLEAEMDSDPACKSTSPGMVAIRYRSAAGELSFVTTITSFSEPVADDVTDLRVECSFPADTATARRCEAMRH